MRKNSDQKSDEDSQDLLFGESDNRGQQLTGFTSAQDQARIRPEQTMQEPQKKSKKRGFDEAFPGEKGDEIHAYFERLNLGADLPLPSS